MLALGSFSFYMIQLIHTWLTINWTPIPSTFLNDFVKLNDIIYDRMFFLKKKFTDIL